MAEHTVHVNNYYVDVDVTHFIPCQPMHWGATPEDSCEGDEYQLEFDVIQAVYIPVASSDTDELPTRDDIEEALVELLH